MKIVKDEVTNQRPQIQITPDLLKNSKTTECGNCGGIIFSEKLVFKKLSALLTSSGREETVPIPVLVCESCGKILSDSDPFGIFPDELKDVNKKL